jgi:phasin family protein
VQRNIGLRSQPRRTIDMATNGKHNFLDFDMSKVFSGFNFPGLDIDSLVSAQRKNIEAFTQANQLAVEGVQAVARRQVELARQAVDEASSLMREWTAPGAPEERMAKNVELAKTAFEKGVANTRELTELVSKANTEAFGVIQKRFAESLEEISEFAKHKAAR